MRIHIASAEQAAVDLVLTTDDRLVRQINRSLGNPAIKVMNPVNWAKEFKP
jgi:hypothetical protein